MTYLAAAIAFALFNRLRGGLIAMPGGTHVARLIWWALPCGLLAWVFAPWWVAALVAVGAFIGCTAGEHDSQSMGLKGGVSGAATWGWMTLWGLARVAGPAAAIAWWHPSWGVAGLVISGLLCAPIYYAVRWLPDWMLFAKGFGAGTGPGAARDPAEWAELLHGAAMGVGLLMALS